MAVTVYLTRRNLLTLLDKLDKNKSVPGHSACTIVKQDIVHPVYPMIGSDEVWIKALEDEEYYTERKPGIMMEELGDV